MEKGSLTSIQQLGKFKLLQQLSDKFYITRSTKLPIHTTLLLEHVDFDLTYFPLKHLGYKAVICEISKVISMGYNVKYLSFCLAVSSRFSVEAIEEIYAGIKLACDNYLVDIIHHDIIASNGGLTISVCSIGDLNDSTSPVVTNNPRPGDVLCVTGDLGAAYIGLQILIREKRIYMEHPTVQPSLEQYSYFIERQLKPEARVDILEYFAINNIKPTSMVCIDSGLGSALLSIKQQFNLGIKVYEDKLPINQDTYENSINLNIVPTTCAFNGGDDYELLFSIKASDYDKIEKHNDIAVIGDINNDSNTVLITKGGAVEQIVAQSW